MTKIDNKRVQFIINKIERGGGIICFPLNIFIYIFLFFACLMVGAEILDGGEQPLFMLAISLLLSTLLYGFTYLFIKSIEDSGFKLACATLGRGELESAIQYVFIRPHTKKFYRSAASLYVTSFVLMQIGKSDQSRKIYNLSASKNSLIPDLLEADSSESFDFNLLIELWKMEGAEIHPRRK